MTLPIVLAVLFSALLHATWNSLAHAVSDRLVGFALIGVAEGLGGGLMVAFAGLPPSSAWPFIIASAALHVVYNLLLLVSYQLGEFSQMYPLARGTSPWVVALVSVLVLGRELPIAELAGVLAVSAGLIALVFIGGRPGRRGSARDLGSGADRVGHRLLHRRRRVRRDAGAAVRLHRMDVPAARPTNCGARGDPARPRAARRCPGCRRVPASSAAPSRSSPTRSCCGRRPAVRWRPLPRCGRRASSSAR